MRQLFLETLCLSVAGGALGLLFSTWTATAIPALFMTEHAEALDTTFQPLLILITLGVAVAAGSLFGLAPAAHGTGAPAVTALRADAGGISTQHGGGRLRAMLVGTQVSLSTSLLLATGLLVVTLAHALEGDAQSAVSRVAFVSIELPGRFDDPVRGVAHRDRLLARLPVIGGVEAVGWASTLPLGKGNRRPFHIQGQTAAVMDTVEFETNVVSPGYFGTLSMPCIEGRLFDDNDRTLSPAVVVVDELLARRYFGASAVGQELLDGRGDRVEIVGVVRSSRFRTLQPAPHPTVYYPSTQEYLWRGHLLVRTASDPAGLLEPISRAVREVGEDADTLRTGTLGAYLSESLVLDRLTTTLVGLCSLIALAMSTIGVYGVMADAVRRRTREIGLRVALGASRMRVIRLVFSEVLYLALTGLLAGAAVTLVSTYVARSFVSGVPSLNVANVAAAAAALAVVVVIASVVPLRRALSVNPNIALRAE
jgi:putative ABC transport system permease protein